jgi:hypothetical protein
MKIQKIDIIPKKILDLLRDNFVLIIVAGIFTFIFNDKDVFKGPLYYDILSGLALLLIFIIIKKYRDPFYYSPSHIFFVKDRNDSIIKLEPILDPLLTKLGLVRYEDFVNIRYILYPDLPTGIDFNPNTGLISGFPMEVGNHTSEVKMRFLGGEYSTNIRIEVVNTLKEKMVVPERDKFAPPRTVAQLLLREEDVLKREQDLDYSLAQEKEAFAREYNIKELSLKSKFDSEKSKLAKELADVKRDHDNQLKQKDLEITKLDSDMKDKLEEINQEKSNQIEKVESEMVTALQDKEREFNEFEKEIKSKFEAKERELEDSYKVEEVVEEEPVEEEIEEVVEEEPVEEELEEEVVEEEPVEEEPKEEVVEEEPVEEEPEEEVVEEEPVEVELEEEVEEEPVEEEIEEEVVKEESVEEEPEEEVVEEEPVEEEPEEEYDYVSMTKAELVELAKKRGLPVSGPKKKIISRLEENN